MNNYNKPVKNTKEQIEELIRRGLIIDNFNKAKDKIESIGYYRISQYFKVYQLTAISRTGEVIIYPNGLIKYKNKFYENTSFEDILDIYKFDKNLRLLTYDIIETFEVDLKSKLINTLSHKLGISSPYLDDSIYKSEKSYKNILVEIDKILNDSKFKNHEIGKHFFLKYNSEKYPPIWMLLNNVGFGFLMNFYNSLEFKIKEEISIMYGYDNYRDFSKIIGIIRELRNKVAHHDRLFNTSYMYGIRKISFVELLFLLEGLECKIYGDNSLIIKIATFYKDNKLKCISEKLCFPLKTTKSP